MLEVCVKLNEKEYLAFLSEANEAGLRADEMLNEIVQYYIRVNKKRFKLEFAKNQLDRLDKNS